MPRLLCCALLFNAVPLFAGDFQPGPVLETARKNIREDKRPPLDAGIVLELPEGGIGFATGNIFTATVLRGEVTVSCNDHRGGSDMARFRCTGETLDPAEFVRFAGPKGLDADNVRLTATWENGKSRAKSEGYDPAKGQSRGRFNLWIATLLQRPLLDYGNNAIHYTFEKDGAAVLQGDLIAEVRKGAQRTCRYRRHYSSNDISDCRNGGNICDRYFRDENYCQ